MRVVVVLNEVRDLLVGLRMKQVLRMWLRTTALLLCIATSLHAQSADARIRAQRDELERIRREREGLEQRMTTLQNTVHDMREEKANLDNQRKTTEEMLKVLDRQLVAITNDIGTMTNRMALAEGDLVYRRGALQKRLVDIYKRGPQYSAQALLTAHSFGELIARYKYLHEIAAYDRGIVKRVEVLRDDIARQRGELVKLKDAVEENRSEKQHEEDRLSLLSKQRASNIQDAQRTTKTIQDRLSRIRESESRISGVIASADAERRKTETSRPNAPKAASTLRTSDLGRLDWPVDGTFLFRFGRVINPNNTTTRWNGVGIAAPAGTSVKSVAPGTVVSAAPLGTYGLTVILDHGGGYFSIYASLNSAAVRKGATVRKGDVLGTVGVSDPDLAPHLHFEIRTPPDGRAVDPESWLRGH